MRAGSDAEVARAVRIAGGRDGVGAPVVDMLRRAPLGRGRVASAEGGPGDGAAGGVGGG